MITTSVFDNLNNKINAYFTVGDFLKNDPKRIPQSSESKQNLIMLAEKIEYLKNKSSVNFLVTSSYMPPSMSRRKGITNEFKTNKGWTTNHPMSRGEWASIVPTIPSDFIFLVEDVRKFWSGGDYNIPYGHHWINLYLHKINYMFDYEK